MRLKEINKSLHEGDTNSVRFRSWFQGSVVTDQQGEPLVCYHGTAETFNRFRPLSHFGTVGAANDIINIRRSTSANIVPVYLCIRKPLRYEDSGRDSQWSVSDVVDTTDPALWEEMTSEELDWLQEDDTEDRAKFFINYLGDLGYDGLVYTNRIENRGSTSWVIFSPRQVWPIYQQSADDDTGETPREELLRLALLHHSDKAPTEIQAQIDRVDDHSLPVVLDRYRWLTRS